MIGCCKCFAFILPITLALGQKFTLTKLQNDLAFFCPKPSGDVLQDSHNILERWFISSERTDQILRFVSLHLPTYLFFSSAHMVSMRSEHIMTTPIPCCPHVTLFNNFFKMFRFFVHLKDPFGAKALLSGSDLEMWCYGQECCGKRKEQRYNDFVFKWIMIRVHTK